MDIWRKTVRKVSSAPLLPVVQEYALCLFTPARECRHILTGAIGREGPESLRVYSLQILIVRPPQSIGIPKLNPIFSDPSSSYSPNQLSLGILSSHASGSREAILLLLHEVYHQSWSML